MHLGLFKAIWQVSIWVHSSVVRAADCRSAGPWFKSGCALFCARLFQSSTSKLILSSTSELLLPLQVYLDRCAYLQIVGWAGAVGLPWAPAPPLPLPFPKCAKLLLRRGGVRAATLQFREGKREVRGRGIEMQAQHAATQQHCKVTSSQRGKGGPKASVHVLPMSFLVWWIWA